MHSIILKKVIIASLPVVFAITACTRNTIEFGTVPENNYSNLSYIDTIGVNLSTVLIDSFATGGATSFLLGKYKDAYTGTITAKPFFQVDKPVTIPDIPVTAVYDSIVCVLRPNEYYYGDTTIAQTIYVNELSQSILLSYADQLYNTTPVAVKPTPLGSRTLRIRPLADDSILIRLDNAKGAELFDKLQQKAAEINSTDNFLNYFKGLSLSTDPSNVTAVIGLTGGANLALRLFYHTNTPYEELHTVDFPSISNAYAFNQVLSDRSGTGIIPGNTGVTELLSSQTGGYSFSQPGTGLKLKLSFPSLKSVLQLGSYVKLLRADLVVRPAYLSFDYGKYYLPAQLGLTSTNGSNISGAALTDSTGTGTLYASPVIDAIYGENTYYQFNITPYITQLLAGTGNTDSGLFITEADANDGSRATRLIVGGSGHNNYVTELQLSVLIVK